MKKILLIILISFLSNSTFADEKMKIGLEVFNNKAQCGTCHALQAADAESQIGPNLDMLKPLMPQIINVVTNGAGMMPPWSDILTPEEIEAVAYYVFNSTNN